MATCPGAGEGSGQNRADRQ